MSRKEMINLQKASFEKLTALLKALDRFRKVRKA